MERLFDEELTKLKERLLRMAGLVEEAIELAIQALKERREDLTEEVFRHEAEINALDVEIDETCLRLLALRQPMAGDLRFITSAMKIGVDLERMGDLAVNIAEQAIELAKLPLLKPLIDIPRMAKMAQAMVRDSLNAFVNRDHALAQDVCCRDDAVDSLNHQIFRELLMYMMEDPGTIKRAVALMLVGRHLERIADHATNIGEDVIYMARGKSIKHNIDGKRTAVCGGTTPEK
jgi:phosphate transport system protein